MLSKAYGEWPERATCEEAYKDLISLKLTTMTKGVSKSNFFPMVVEHVKGGLPPKTVQQTLYFSIDDGEDQ